MVILALGLRLNLVLCMHEGVIIFVANVSAFLIKMCKVLSVKEIVSFQWKCGPSSCDSVWRFPNSWPSSICHHILTEGRGDSLTHGLVLWAQQVHATHHSWPTVVHLRVPSHQSWEVNPTCFDREAFAVTKAIKADHIFLKRPPNQTNSLLHGSKREFS